MLPFRRRPARPRFAEAREILRTRQVTSDDTVILLTPPGGAAIAVVRLAGRGVAAFLARHFDRPVAAGRCVHGTLRDERGEVLDDPVIVFSPDGPFADVSLHGGAWVVRSVLNLAVRAGFPAGHASDESVAAVDADGVLEREVLTHVPLARTELALRTLLAQPQAWADLKARAAASAPGDPAMVAELSRSLADRSLAHLLNPPRVAIVGAPNVGKSTLANQLFAQERSITADLAGTTRDWVGEIANVDGLAVMLIDTPGVRETADPLEGEAIRRSRAEVARADLVVLVLDATHPWTAADEALLAAHPQAIRVINKADRPTAWAHDPPDAIRTVATTGDGVYRLRQSILARFGCLDPAPDWPRVWTDRQRDVVARALAEPDAIAGI